MAVAGSVRAQAGLRLGCCRPRPLFRRNVRPFTIHSDGEWMVRDGQERTSYGPRRRTARRSRSISAIVDLGHIDLLVQDGFYSNRTDFIRTAIRNQLDRHGDVVGSPSRARRWTSACGTIAAPISRRRGRPARRCESTCSASPASPPTSRPSWPRDDRLGHGAGRAARQP